MNERHAGLRVDNRIKQEQSRTHLFISFLLCVAFLSACSIGRPTPTPPPARTVAPTWTATPLTMAGVVVVTPPANGTPGLIVLQPGADLSGMLPPTITPTPTETATPIFTSTPTATETPEPTVPPGSTSTSTPVLSPTPTLTPTETPLPTLTPTPTETPLPTLTPTPFIIVRSGLVGLHSGPGVAYPLIAQLGPDIPITITGKNEDESWYQVCCIGGLALWAAAGEIAVNNDPSTVPLVANIQPPPTPTQTPLPTATGLPTPTATATPYPFGILQQGPEFAPTNNEFLTIWVKLSVGVAAGDPAEGYFLRVQFEGVDRQQTNEVQPSADKYQMNRNPGEGAQREYNLKYEYRPPNLQDDGIPALQAIGRGTWTVWVVDGAGNQISEKVSFFTAPSNPNREVWIHWVRTG